VLVLLANLGLVALVLEQRDDVAHRERRALAGGVLRERRTQAVGLAAGRRQRANELVEQLLFFARQLADVDAIERRLVDRPGLGGTLRSGAVERVDRTRITVVLGLLLAGATHQERQAD
jgi:hypothetical protein